MRDQNILQQNPKRLDTKIQRCATTILREATSDLKGDEKLEKMTELATSVYEALSEAIDELEKDEALNPYLFNILSWPKPKAYTMGNTFPRKKSSK